MTDSDILEPNPFREVIYAKHGNKVARDIFTSMGFALAQWEHCESSFATLFTLLVKPTGSNYLPYRAYGAVLATGSRRDMIEAAAEVYFTLFENDELAERLRKLMVLYKDGAARRNDMAHAVVMGEPNKINPDFFLLPTFVSTKKNKIFHRGTKYRLGVKEIDHYSKCFGALSTRAARLTHDISEFYQSLPEKLRRQYS